jgi:hypothetical protein
VTWVFAGGYSAGAGAPYKRGVTGSNPVAPTNMAVYLRGCRGGERVSAGWRWRVGQASDGQLGPLRGRGLPVMERGGVLQQSVSSRRYVIIFVGGEGQGVLLRRAAVLVDH